MEGTVFQTFKLQATFLYSIYHQRAGKTNLFHMKGGRFHAGNTLCTFNSIKYIGRVDITNFPDFFSSETGFSNLTHSHKDTYGWKNKFLSNIVKCFSKCNGPSLQLIKHLIRYTMLLSKVSHEDGVRPTIIIYLQPGFQIFLHTQNILCVLLGKRYDTR